MNRQELKRTLRELHNIIKDDPSSPVLPELTRMLDEITPGSNVQVLEQIQRGLDTNPVLRESPECQRMFQALKEAKLQDNTGTGAPHKSSSLEQRLAQALGLTVALAASGAAAYHGLDSHHNATHAGKERSQVTAQDAPQAQKARQFADRLLPEKDEAWQDKDRIALLERMVSTPIDGQLPLNEEGAHTIVTYTKSLKRLEKIERLTSRSADENHYAIVEVLAAFAGAMATVYAGRKISAIDKDNNKVSDKLASLIVDTLETALDRQIPPRGMAK